MMTRRFPSDGLLDIDLDDLLETLPGDRDDRPGDDTPEEAEAKAEAEDGGERQRRRLKIETRNRLAWQRFCDRFIRGIAEPEFIDLVGPGVVVGNAIIFNHLLALLIARNVIGAGKGIAYQLQLWSFLWGDHDHGGYLDTLHDDTQFAAIEGNRGTRRRGHRPFRRRPRRPAHLEQWLGRSAHQPARRLAAPSRIPSAGLHRRRHEAHCQPWSPLGDRHRPETRPARPRIEHGGTPHRPRRRSRHRWRQNQRDASHDPRTAARHSAHRRPCCNA